MNHKKNLAKIAPYIVIGACFVFMYFQDQKVQTLEGINNNLNKQLDEVKEEKKLEIKELKAKNEKEILIRDSIISYYETLPKDGTITKNYEEDINIIMSGDWVVIDSILADGGIINR